MPSQAKPDSSLTFMDTFLYRDRSLLRADCPVTRDELMESLLRSGIATRRGCMAIHEEPCYARFRPGKGLPVTEACARDSILLPLFPSMTNEEQDDVVRHLQRFC